MFDTRYPSPNKAKSTLLMKRKVPFLSRAIAFFNNVLACFRTLSSMPFPAVTKPLAICSKKHTAGFEPAINGLDRSYGESNPICFEFTRLIRLPRSKRFFWHTLWHCLVHRSERYFKHTLEVTLQAYCTNSFCL